MVTFETGRRKLIVFRVFRQMVRVGVMVGLAGVSLDRSGTPLRGTRWEHCYAWGVLWGERERARMRREGERA